MLLQQLTILYFWTLIVDLKPICVTDCWIDTLANKIVSIAFVSIADCGSHTGLISKFLLLDLLVVKGIAFMVESYKH